MKIPSLLFAVVLLANSIVAAPKPLAQSLPGGAFAFAEIDGLGRKVQQFKDSGFLAAVLESPQYQAFTKTDEYKRAIGVAKLSETYLGTDLWTAAAKFLGGQLALALYPSDNPAQPDALAVLRTPNVDAMRELRSKILDPILLLAGDGAREEMLNGVKVIDLDGNAFLALGPDWMAASNRRPLMQATVRALVNGKGPTLAASTAFKKMRAKMGEGHFLAAGIDLPAVAKQYNQPLKTPDKLDDGGASLFFHGIIAMAPDSPYLGLTMDIDEKGFSIESAIDGNPREMDEKFGWFFSDPATPGTHDIPAVKGLLGGLTIHRNLGGWYRLREQLLEERLQGGFDEFESGLGNLFPGRDVGDDIMPAFGPTVTFLAAEQNFDHFVGEPGIKLPGFALIFDLEKPMAGKLFQLVFQTIVTITNLAGAEEGLNREPSVMTAIVHNGVPINTIEFLQSPKEKRLDISYNFVPCATTVKGRFVFCTSLALCKALVDEIRKPSKPRRENRNFNLELYPDAVKGLVRANRSTLVARSVQTGKPIEDARQEIDLIQRLLGHVQLIRFNTSVQEDGYKVRLRGRWQ